MHFIGHIKKRKSSELEEGGGGGTDTPSPPVAKKRQKGSPLDAVSEEAKENVASAAAPSSDTVMKCHSCDIGFSQLSNFLAHKKYYCRGLQSSSPNPPPPADKTMSSPKRTTSQEHHEEKSPQSRPEQSRNDIKVS